MKNHKNLILASLLVLAVLVLPLMSAATALYKPIANSNYSGTITQMSCTTDLVNAVNATFLYNVSGGTARNILVANVSNTTDGTTSFNISSVNVGALADSSSYTFWCMVTNLSGAAEITTQNSTVNTGITIDNTNPVCSVIALNPTIPYKGTQLLTVSVTDGIGLQSATSSYITVDGPQTQTTQTYTFASGVGTKTLTSTDTNYIGDWSVIAYGTDRAGNTCSNTKTFKSYLPDGQVTATQATPNNNFRNIAIVGLVIAGIYLIFFRKK